MPDQPTAEWSRKKILRLEAEIRRLEKIVKETNDRVDRIAEAARKYGIVVDDK